MEFELALGVSAPFPAVNSNKREITLDLQRRERVVVKHLEAIENFGSMDVLCSDKTGTLTSGNMMLDRHLDPVGEVSERPLTLAYANSSPRRNSR